MMRKLLMIMEDPYERRLPFNDRPEIDWQVRATPTEGLDTVVQALKTHYNLNEGMDILLGERSLHDIQDYCPEKILTDQEIVFHLARRKGDGCETYGSVSIAYRAPEEAVKGPHIERFSVYFDLASEEEAFKERDIFTPGGKAYTSQPKEDTGPTPVRKTLRNVLRRMLGDNPEGN